MINVKSETKLIILPDLCWMSPYFGRQHLQRQICGGDWMSASYHGKAWRTRLRKKTQHSQLAHIYLKRDKRAMDKRNLKQSRNHESLKNVGFQVWKSSREPRWTEEQCTASTTYCCTKGQARNKLLGSCHTLLYLQQVGASSAAVPPAQHLGMDWGLRPAE